MPYLEIGKEKLPLYYELQGSAEGNRPLVIFFNCWCLSGRYWEKTVQSLLPDFQVLTFDNVGFGRSLPKEGLPETFNTSLNRCVAEAITLVKQLDIAPERLIQVVGHSEGGPVAARYARKLEQEGRLAGLTIVNCGSFEPDKRFGNLLIPFVKIFVWAKSLFGLPGIRRAVIQRSCALPISKADEQLIINDLLSADRRCALEISLSSLEPHNLDLYEEDLISIQSPVLLVVGDRDATIPPSGMYNIKRFKPECNLVPFPRCGHFPMLEQPERFSNALINHFRNLPWEGSKGVRNLEPHITQNS